MTHRIHITSAARADMAFIDARLMDISPQSADRNRTLIENAIASLAEFPNRYALAPEAEIHGKQVRHVVVGRYRVIYMVILETVNILRLRHVVQPPVEPGELN